MANYFDQEINLEKVKSATSFDLYSPLHISSLIPMTFSKACDHYGHFSLIPLPGCDNYALSNNGILFNTKSNKIITPEIEYDELGKPNRAILHLPGRKVNMDAAELVIISRFHIDPNNVKIKYNLTTDGTAIFMSNLLIQFKEPTPLDIPEEHGLLARRFYDQYFISRVGGSKTLVSQSGAMYDPISQRFMPIYLQKIYSRVDRAMILRTVAYPYGRPKPLLDYVIEEWSGYDIPHEYLAVSTSGIPSKITLKDFIIRDMRTRTIKNPSIYSQRLHEKRSETLNNFRSAVDGGIRDTMRLLRKYDPK